MIDPSDLNMAIGFYKLKYPEEIMEKYERSNTSGSISDEDGKQPERDSHKICMICWKVFKKW